MYFLNINKNTVNEYNKKSCVSKIFFSYLYKNEESFILMVTYL